LKTGEENLQKKIRERGNAARKIRKSSFSGTKTIFNSRNGNRDKKIL
jgi:hypothetical protein